MLSAKAKHPNCAYKWMDWIISPKVNAQVAEYFGEAPSNAKACDETSDKNFCDTYHATDEGYWKNIALLDHAHRAVPRRPYGREVRALRQVGPGLDRDQGLRRR